MTSTTENFQAYAEMREQEDIEMISAPLTEAPTILGHVFFNSPEEEMQVWEDCNRDIVVFMQELSSWEAGVVLLSKIKPDHTPTPEGFWAPTYLVTSSSTLLDRDAMWLLYRESPTRQLVNANVECDWFNPLYPTDIPGVWEYTPWMGG
jgi:hypothetical protein